MNNLIRTEEMQNQTAKADAGKARLSLVPFQIVYMYWMWIVSLEKL